MNMIRKIASSHTNTSRPQKHMETRHTVVLLWILWVLHRLIPSACRTEILLCWFFLRCFRCCRRGLWRHGGQCSGLLCPGRLFSDCYTCILSRLDCPACPTKRARGCHEALFGSSVRTKTCLCYWYTYLVLGVLLLDGFSCPLSYAVALLKYLQALYTGAPVMTVHTRLFTCCHAPRDECTKCDPETPTMKRSFCPKIMAN